MNRPIASLRMIKPSDCAFVFGLPVTQSAFERAVLNPASDYVKHWLGGWTQYDSYFAANARRFLIALNIWKVETITDATLSKFADAFASGKTVVTLFSHWTTNEIEFSDGLVDIQSVVNMIPMNF